MDKMIVSVEKVTDVAPKPEMKSNKQNGPDC